MCLEIGVVLKERAGWASSQVRHVTGYLVASRRVELGSRLTRGCANATSSPTCRRGGRGPVRPAAEWRSLPRSLFPGLGLTPSC